MIITAGNPFPWNIAVVRTGWLVGQGHRIVQTNILCFLFLNLQQTLLMLCATLHTRLQTKYVVKVRIVVFTSVNRIVFLRFDKAYTVCVLI